ncbi:MAG: hypothetical protein ACO1OB_27845, partial [Archangium sp.]
MSLSASELKPPEETCFFDSSAFHALRSARSSLRSAAVIDSFSFSPLSSMTYSIHDRRRRRLSRQQRQLLADCAAIVASEMELRRQIRE